MNRRALVRIIPMLIMAWATTGCVPMILPLYSADPSQGKVLFSDCAIDKNVPGGIELRLGDVIAKVRLEQTFSSRFVEVRLDVPLNTTVQLQSDVVTIDRHDGRAPIEAHYPNISLVDGPAIHSFDTPPALARYMVPVHTPLVGAAIPIGNQMFPKHYWMAVRVDTEGAEEVTITLPAMLIDGVPAQFPKLDFHKGIFAVLAAFNC